MDRRDKFPGQVRTSTNSVMIGPRDAPLTRPAQGQALVPVTHAVMFDNLYF
jgi:hypothetical protein